MTQQVGSVFVKIGADLTQFNNGLHQVEQGVGGLERSLAQRGQSLMLAGGALSAAVTAPILGMFAAVTKEAATFESQMNVLTIAARDSGRPMRQLSDAAVAIGMDLQLIGIDAQEAATAMTTFYKSGMSTADMFGDLDKYLREGTNLTGAMRSAVDLATASNLSLAEASMAVSTAMATFGLTADDSTAISNTFVQAADASLMEVRDLAEAFVNAGTSAAGMGIDLREASTALAILSQSGSLGSEAGTRFKSMLNAMSAPTDKAAKTLKSLGISFYDAAGNMKSLPEIIAHLNTQLHGMTQEARDAFMHDIFGTYGVGAARALLASGAEGWAEMTEQMNGAATAAEVGKARTQGLAAAWEQFRGVLQAIMLKVGEPLLKGFLTPLVQLLTRLGGVIHGLPTWVLGLGLALAALAAAVGPVLLGLGGLMSLVSALGPVVAPAIAAVAALAPTLLPVVAVVAALGAALWLLRKPIAKVAGAVGDLLQEPLGDIAEWAGKRWTDLVGVWRRVQMRLIAGWSGLKGVAIRALDSIGEWAERTWTSVVGVWRRAQMALIGPWYALRHAVKVALDAAWGEVVQFADGIRDRLGGAWDAVKQRAGSALGGLGDRLARALGPLGDALGNVWHGLRSTAGQVRDALSGLLGDLSRGDWEAAGAKVAAALGVVRAALGESWRVVSGAVGRALGEARVAVERFGSLALASLAERFPNVAALAVSAFETVRGAVSGLVEAARGPLTALWEAVRAGDWDAVGGMVAGAFEQVRGAVGRVIDRVRQMDAADWRALGKDLRDRFVGAWDWVRLTASTLGRDVAAWVSGTVAEALGGRTLGEILGDWLKEGPVGRLKFGAVLEGLGSVDEGVRSILGSLFNLPDVAVGFEGPGLAAPQFEAPDWGDIGEAAWASFVAGAGAAWDKVPPLGDLVRQWASNTLTGDPTATWPELWKDMRQWVGGQWDEAVKSVGPFYDKVVDWLTAKWGDAALVMPDLIANIDAWLTGAIAWVREKGTNLGDKLRVFMGSVLGLNRDYDFAMNFEARMPDMTGLPDEAQDQMRDAARAASQAMSSETASWRDIGSYLANDVILGFLDRAVQWTADLEAFFTCQEGHQMMTSIGAVLGKALQGAMALALGLMFGVPEPMQETYAGKLVNSLHEILENALGAILQMARHLGAGFIRAALGGDPEQIYNEIMAEWDKLAAERAFTEGAVPFPREFGGPQEAREGYVGWSAPGEWATPSEQYAQQYADLGPVIAKQIEGMSVVEVIANPPEDWGAADTYALYMQRYYERIDDYLEGLGVGPQNVPERTDTEWSGIDSPPITGVGLWGSAQGGGLAGYQATGEEVGTSEFEEVLTDLTRDLGFYGGSLATYAGELAAALLGKGPLANEKEAFGYYAPEGFDMYQRWLEMGGSLSTFAAVLALAALGLGPLATEAEKAGTGLKTTGEQANLAAEGMVSANTQLKWFEDKVRLSYAATETLYARLTNTNVSLNTFCGWLDKIARRPTDLGAQTADQYAASAARSGQATARAFGGIHQGGLALVGERGEEVVALPRQSRVFRNEDSGRGGVNVYVTIQGNADERDVRIGVLKGMREWGVR